MDMQNRFKPASNFILLVVPRRCFASVVVLIDVLCCLHLVLFYIFS